MPLWIGRRQKSSRDARHSWKTSRAGTTTLSVFQENSLDTSATASGISRVLYRIDDKADRVNVMAIAHRSEVYE